MRTHRRKRHSLALRVKNSLNEPLMSCKKTGEERMLILPREQLEQRVTRNEDMQSFRCQRQTYRIVYRTVSSIDKLHV